jgi:hypothetical protein
VGEGGAFTKKEREEGVWIRCSILLSLADGKI